MDEAGQRNFSKALAVAKQIFNSLTEYIQVTFFLCHLHLQKYDTDIILRLLLFLPASPRDY